MHTWWITSCPYVCAKAITVGWVEGSSKKERNVSLFPSATPLRRGRRWGWAITTVAVGYHNSDGMVDKGKPSSAKSDVFFTNCVNGP